MLSHVERERDCVGHRVFKLIHFWYALNEIRIFNAHFFLKFFNHANSFLQILNFDLNLLRLPQIRLPRGNLLNCFKWFLELIQIESRDNDFIAFQQKKLRVVLEFPVCSWHAFNAAIPST